MSARSRDSRPTRTAHGHGSNSQSVTAKMTTETVVTDCTVRSDSVSVVVLLNKYGYRTLCLHRRHHPPGPALARERHVPQPHGRDEPRGGGQQADAAGGGGHEVDLVRVRVRGRVRVRVSLTVPLTVPLTLAFTLALTLSLTR